MPAATLGTGTFRSRENSDTTHQALARYTLGRVQQRLGDYAGAIVSYEQALSLCRDHADAHEVRDKLLAGVL